MLHIIGGAGCTSAKLHATHTYIIDWVYTYSTVYVNTIQCCVTYWRLYHPLTRITVLGPVTNGGCVFVCVKACWCGQQVFGVTDCRGAPSTSVSRAAVGQR